MAGVTVVENSYSSVSFDDDDINDNWLINLKCLWILQSASILNQILSTIKQAINHKN